MTVKRLKTMKNEMTSVWLELLFSYLVSFHFTHGLIFAVLARLNWWQNCTADNTAPISSLMIKKLYDFREIMAEGKMTANGLVLWGLFYPSWVTREAYHCSSECVHLQVTLTHARTAAGTHREIWSVCSLPPPKGQVERKP